MFSFLAMIVIGAIAGFVARALVPNDGLSGVLPTIALGIVGSFVGGFLGYVLFSHNVADGALQTSGIVGSIVGSVIALFVYRAVSGGKTANA